MTATLQVNPAEVNRLESVLKRILDATSKATPDLLTQAFVFAVQSATKATKPGTSGTVKGLAKKYRVRPVEELPAASGNWYHWTRKDGKIRFFHSDRQISEKPNLTRIVRGIKWWDKRKSDWNWFPTTQKGKWGDGKVGKIPYYGAAKAGFLHMLGQLGRPQDTGELRSSLATVSKKLTGNEQFILGENEVSYAATTSPDAARIGIDKAASRLEKTYRKTLDAIVLLPGAEAWAR